MRVPFQPIIKGLLLGVGAYLIYVGLIVPVFILPRSARQRVISPRPVTDASSEAERMSREISDLLASVFPDPADWRRVHPLSVIPKDRGWILLFPSQPSPHGDMITVESCTIVVPNADTALSESERFRRAFVIETNGKVEFRFKNRLDFRSLADSFSFGNLESGRVFDKVTVWSHMDPETRADDFRLTARNISFNCDLGQISTDSEVSVHYGNRQAEGIGLHVNIGLPPQKETETAPSDPPEDEPDPLIDAYTEGNLALGFSIRDVSLDKLTRLEFEMPDYLPSVSDIDPWGDSAPDGGASDPEPVSVGEEQTVAVGIRCSDKVYFAPNVADAPSTWCARFSGDVEITSAHKDRQPDSLRCDSLYFYLNDPVLERMWAQYGASYKGRRKPTGKLIRLSPVQVRATGSPERESFLQAADGFFSAKGGEILCNIVRRRVTLQPLPEPLTPSGPLDPAPKEKQVVLCYGRANVLSDRVEFTYDPESFGELRAYKKGRLETELPAEPGQEADRLTVTWNDLVQITPQKDKPNRYTAVFSGGVRADSKAFGALTAREAVFWFTTRSKDESPGEDAAPAVSPRSAALRGGVEMVTGRGECRIRDDMNILFTRQSAADSPSPASSGAGGKNPFADGGSLMGDESGASYALSAGSLDLCAFLKPGGGVDISNILMKDDFLFVETDPVTKSEVLRIAGSAVRIDNPGGDAVKVRLRGDSATFTGNGLNLKGDDIRVSRPDNMFSVVGDGSLGFVVPKGSGISGGAVSDEPVEVWWPGDMTFDGRQLIFRGKVPPEGAALAAPPKENELVRVRQGESLILKSPLISLSLRRPVRLFDFDMGTASSGAARFELDTITCQGSSGSPVSVSWLGTLPEESGSGRDRPLRARAGGEVSRVTLHSDTGEFTASGPGWLRGTAETPTAAPSGGDLLPASKPWTHFHLVFGDSITGNIRSQTAKFGGGVRLVMAGSDSSRLDLNVNDHASFPPEAFFLTCEQLAAAGIASPGGGSRNLELTALGDTRFDYQTFTGRGEVLKYDHRKRTVLLQGSGITPAALSQQQRPGAPANTQTFSSASFNLETKNIDLNISGTGFSPGN